MATYETWVSEGIAPGFFRRKWGKLFMRTLGYTLDLVSDAAKAGVKARFPTLAPDDALGYVGDGRNIDKYRAESDASYRDAVAVARMQWERAGTIGDTYTGLKNKVLRLGYPTVEIIPWYIAKDLVPGPADVPQTAPYAEWWSSFYVVISPNVFPKRHWGDTGLTWGMQVPSAVGNPIGTIVWGSGANHHDVAELRRCIHKWKSAHEICPFVIFRDTANDDVFSPANSFIGTRSYRP